MTVEEQREALEAFEDARCQLIDAIDADLRKRETPPKRERFDNGDTSDK